MRALWLVGMMGSGKTAVGALVAAQIGLPFVDVDSRIESECSRTITAIFENDDEEAFRDLETGQIARIVTTGDDCVVATGGGVVLRPENVAAMRGSGLVVWLTAQPEELAARLENDRSRPLLLDRGTDQRLAQLLMERASAYAQAAHRVVETVGKTPDEVAREVMVLWNAF